MPGSLLNNISRNVPLGRARLRQAGAMGKQRQPQDDPPLEPRDQQDFERMLQQQYELIAESGKLFDAGHLVFALPLSSAIKNVVYEVLVGLGVRDTLLFEDTALHINPANMLPGNPAHVVLRFAPAPQQPEWSAPGIRNLPPARQHPPLQFSDWWGMPLTMDTAKPPHTWSRKDLVMRIRDKDGGSHVDPYRPPKASEPWRETGH